MSVTLMKIIRRSRLTGGIALSIFFSQHLQAETTNKCAALFVESTNNVSQKSTAIRIPQITDDIHEMSNQAIVDYQNAVASLSNAPSGTVIDFGSGRHFVLDKILGEGGSTIIIKTQDRKVFRIYKLGSDAMPATDLVTFVKLQAELESDGVPVVKVDLSESLLPRVLRVEEKNILMTLDDFNRGKARVPMTAAEMKLARERLFEFARKTWKYTYVGDFGATELGYDGTSWFIFDFGKMNTRIQNHLERETIFTSINMEGARVRCVSEELENKFADLIKRERIYRFQNGEWSDAAQPVFFKRAKAVADEEGLIVADESFEPGFMPKVGRRERGDRLFKNWYIPEKYLAKSAKDNYKFTKNSSGEKVVLLQFSHVKELGPTSVIYSALLDGKSKVLVEIPLTITTKKDLFSADHPLLKARGVKTRELDAIGPDYVMVIKK